MPKKIEEPVTVQQTLTARDFAEAFQAALFFSAPMRRRSVRMLMCITAGGIAASFLPLSWARVSVRATLIAVSVLCLAAGIVIWLFQPVWQRNRAENWFRCCPLAALPAKITLSRRSAEIVTECEHMVEYWTDFSLCVETDRLICAAGGRQRFLLVLKKEGLPSEQAEELSGLMRYAFDGRWYRMPSRKGGS
ncbi:hypothetical protein [Thermocaproicibacter melissae]|uniref:hypothetical protein n=1 Tax=Thermocaproicibacter melissae TaxID=2966552 RepID=UPI0024B0635B|nr:hypothetical protein [Thermocaproicibacter melissae]WBY64444.1 hypothetical protein NOG13_01640 [Thermocaproicibacter melissae]